MPMVLFVVGVFDPPAEVLETIRRTMAELREKLGRERVTFGELHEEGEDAETPEA